MKLWFLAILAVGPTALAAQDVEEVYDSRPIMVTPEHETAVARGLEWLASHQNEDGSWTAKIGAWNSRFGSRCAV